MKVPYIGITGFMTRYEVLSVLSSYPLHAPRKVMIGVLASLKSLRGEINKRPMRYPKAEEIKNIFIEHPLALNLIHYNTKEPDTLLSQLLKMTEFGGPNFHGFQLNMAWPVLKTLKLYKKQHPEKQIVLQVGHKAMELVMKSPSILANHVERYEGFVDYVLLDPSGGLGKPFDVEEMRKYLEAISSRNLEIGLVVAGGLSPTTLDTIEPLIKTNISSDAEGRLRNKDDSLDLIVAIQYLLKSLQMFARGFISDEDLISMNEAQLKEEVIKLRSAIREHRDQIGDDRCWVDDIALYKKLPDNTPIILNLPPEEIMMPNCLRFWKTRQCLENQNKLHEW